MSRPSVLISGASIAGPALAHWLHRYGFDVSVVERAPGLREEGQNVDVRGAGREVLRRMGLDEAALARGTTEDGTAFVDADGRTVAGFPPATGDTDGATAELEILRGELSALLHESTRGEVEHFFGDQIADLDDREDGVVVTFASGERRQVDVVVIAEGVGSRTRGKVFAGSPVRPLGMYCAYLTIPRTAADDRRWRWYNALEGRSVHLRPDNTGTTRAVMTFLSDTRGLDDLDPAGQATVLRRVFTGAGWESERVLRGLEGGSFYFEDLAQVHQPTWSRGRVVLLGDAAHCAAPLSGMGTTLAITGAYVLAGELAATADHRVAFERYEQRLRPFVDAAQDLPPGTPWVANPRTRRHRTLLHTAVRAMSSAPVRRLAAVAGARITPAADEFTLPDYTPRASLTSAP